MRLQDRVAIVTGGANGIGRADSTFAYAAYAAAKAGITGLTRQLARELGPFGIGVNRIRPGAVLSERMVARFQADWKDAGENARSQTTPLRRMARPAEVAAAAAFPASDDASFITGVTLDVNGGRYTR